MLPALGCKREQRTFVMKKLLNRRKGAEPEITEEMGSGEGRGVVLLGESEGKDTVDLGQMRSQWGWNRLCAMFMKSQGLSQAHRRVERLLSPATEYLERQAGV